MSHTIWVIDLQHRCSGKLEDLGDTAMSAQRHDDAISHYSAILSLTPAAPQSFFIKRSKAYLASDLWEDALNDANKVRFVCLPHAGFVDGIIAR